MIKSMPNRETFDIWVCQRNPFELLYIKTTITCSWEQAEKACCIIDSVLAESAFILCYDLTSNRHN